MYKCLSCGHIFNEPRWIKEDYGEELPHCPECLDDNYADLGDLECPICHGIMANPSERYCEECKIEIKRTMTAFMLEMKIDGLDRNIEVIDLVRDMCDEGVGMDLTTKEAIVAERFLKVMLRFANDRGCSFMAALEMAWDWCVDSKYLRGCKTI